MRSVSIEQRWKKISLILKNIVKETVSEEQHDKKDKWFDGECKKNFF